VLVRSHSFIGCEILRTPPDKYWKGPKFLNMAVRGIFYSYTYLLDKSQVALLHMNAQVNNEAVSKQSCFQEKW
jgi:hypothetical protein